MVVKKLAGFFNTDAEAHSETDTLLVYYSGHGALGTGNWGLHDGQLSFDDVIGLWDGSVAQKNAKVLVLVMDSCFSGCWVEQVWMGAPHLG